MNPEFFNQLYKNTWLMFLLVIIDMVLRGMALWRAGGKKQKYWFVALFIVNSVGILPAVYLLWGEKIDKFLSRFKKG